MAAGIGGIDPRVLAATYALGLVGGLIGLAVGLPLGMMLGAMIATGLATMGGLRVFGARLAAPPSWRHVLVPVIGVAIGARFPPDVLDPLSRWWVTLAALCLFLPLVHLIAMAMFRRLGGLDRRTAYYAAMPGGLIEALILGERAGAEPQMLMLLQFLRLILTILAVPLVFALLFDMNDALAGPADAVAPIAPWDWALMVVAAVLGWWGGLKLRLPAAVLVGPLMLSALFHATALTQAAPPDWMVLTVQWVIGTALGVRFSGLTGARLVLAFKLAAGSVAMMLALATAVALALSDSVGEPVAAVILAFAPGGVSEMALVALSLELSAIYVTLHHVVRIVLSVLIAKAAAGWLAR